MTEEDESGTAACKVGYDKPPRATQFRPGWSGNPKGRPKGSKNFVKLIEAELSERISVTENGRRRKITKKQAIAKQMVNQAVIGNDKAWGRVLDETRAYETANMANSENLQKNEPHTKEYLKSLSDEELASLYRATIARSCES